MPTHIKSLSRHNISDGSLIWNGGSAAQEYSMIPWGHIKLLIDKYHDNPEKIIFYIDKVIENNWSRAVLLNFGGTDLYERQRQAITNFQYTLPNGIGDLA